MSLKGLSEKRRQKRHTFNMPDGSVLHRCAEVDNYHSLRRGNTNVRLSNGWTEEECANNRRENYKNSKYTFNMPDGSVLHGFRDVDRYYDLALGTTWRRLHRGWTEEECANNSGSTVGYTFYMPDGSVLHEFEDVDRYHNLKVGITEQRVCYEFWSTAECANNKSNSPKHIFHMPDGTILYRCKDVDKYYNFNEYITSARLKLGWTEEECASNKREVYKNSKYVFSMSDGSVFYRCSDVDRYHNLRIGTTASRISRAGWTEEECANNKKKSFFKNPEHAFHMPDGSVLYTCADVDRYYNLGRGTTRSRLRLGWTEEECANNGRKGGQKKYIFNMPDGSVLYSCIDVDRYYNLKDGTTSQRLRKTGWVEEECANNKRVK